MEETGSLENPIPSGKCYLDLNRAPRTRRRKLPDQSVAGYTEVTWAEDRATRGRDRSAEPGAKTGVGGRTPPLGIPGIGRKAINPITCICISEWRSENQGLPRARRAGKVAGSKAIMSGCMRLRRTACVAIMVLQKRPCFCSPAARPDICPDRRAQSRARRYGMILGPDDGTQVVVQSPKPQVQVAWTLARCLRQAQMGCFHLVLVAE